MASHEQRVPNFLSWGTRKYLAKDSNRIEYGYNYDWCPAADIQNASFSHLTENS